VCLTATPNNIGKTKVDGARLDLFAFVELMLGVLGTNREIGKEVPNIAIGQVHEPCQSRYD
jgi:hypothetical protein